MRYALGILIVSMFVPGCGCGPQNAAPWGDRDGALDVGGCIESCQQAGANCGRVADGCGNVLECGDCPANETCGGGGIPGVCGQLCKPRTCADQAISCGPAGDGCGGLLDCGACTAPQTCGGGGQHSVCGGTSGCVPITCAGLGLHCGPAGDGCGGLLDCGTCTPPDSCGGAGTHGVCGHTGSGSCVPKTCASLNYNCGPASDGCGALLECGTCVAPQTCGGGGVSGRCGGNSGCVPKTCSQLGVQCGPAGDGCGGLLQCGTCTPPDICGGGGTPGVCGGGTPDGGVTCTNLCLRRHPCDGGTATSISGTVRNPAGVDPIYNALVYIPNATVQPFTPGVSCDKCGAEVSGSPLVRATTGPDGKFVLNDVPVGANIPLVIQIGRWRRQVVIPNVASCTNNALPTSLTRLPKNKSEGDIPLMAMVTGTVDALECVVRKMGVDDAEFTVPASQGGTGRIQFFRSEVRDCATVSPTCYGRGADVTGGAPYSNVLTESSTALAKYDMVLFGCEGLPYDKADDQQRIINYANAGGRVFATHYAYAWLSNGWKNPAGAGPVPFSGTANWHFWQSFLPEPFIAAVDTSFPKGQAFAQWLQIVGAQYAPSQVALNKARQDVSSVVSPSQRWIHSTTPQTVQHYTFNTPVGTPAADQCGRVLFSDFHVTNVYSYDQTFPTECSGTTLTPQEKILEFMIFDLSNCIQPDNPPPPPTCTPLTCAQLGFNCGPAGDGCGGALNCGTCVPPDSCGGGGVPGVCGHTVCPAKNCADQGLQCGPAGDGCGNQIECGPCVPPDTCGGGGTPGVCGHAACTPLTCVQQGLGCGPAGDGCGHEIDCGPCVPPDTCGGGGVPGVCGHIMTCQPYTCTELGFTCGMAGDGCGHQLDCGNCTPPDTCGGGGVPGVCGHLTCPPTTCVEQDIECGPAGDGCGNLLDCGPCIPPDTCGGGGIPGHCGSIGPPG